jgi:signal transduction histidine kinase
LRSILQKSLKYQLIVLTITVTIIALLIDFTLDLFVDIRNFKKELISDSNALAQLMGEYCVVPLASYEETHGLDITLSKFQDFPMIISSVVFDNSGKILGNYLKFQEELFIPKIPATGDSTYFEDNYLHLYQSLHFQGKRYGTIYLRVSDERFREQINSRILIHGLILFGVIIASYLLSLILQGKFLKPIFDLVTLIKQVIEKSDYSIRSPIKRDDEFGVLIRGFNKMLEQIQLRDKQRDKVALELNEKIQQLRKAQEASLNITEDLSIEINERKSAEHKVKQYSENLEGKVAERTKELEETSKTLHESQQAMIILLEDINESRDDLQVTNEKLKEANKELEAFAYSVSHDLRAPLRHIDGFSEILHERLLSSLDKKSSKYLLNISGAAKKMGTLIDDLLVFSRLGRTDLVKIPVDLNQLILDVKRALKPDYRNRHIDWQLGILPTVKCDLSMLRQVFFNILINAIKFTSKKDRARIEIGCQNDEENFTIFVKDNGAGFNMKYADNLFGVFQRLHTHDEFEGTGIGLANVRKIIIRHGGKVWATGEVNKGAGFYFTLPKL